MDKTRGFVTIATGQERYFVLARNLMYSYRQFASKGYPFAIICDKDNEYTAEFDDIILLDHATGSYIDKLKLYNNLPYDETIFVDADCTAYGDLDAWWPMFEHGDSFSLFGYAWTDLKSGRGWFRPEGLKEFRDMVSYIPDFNGGVYYMRKSETCARVFELAVYFAEHYQEYAFTGFAKPADEPCLALAMAVLGCMPIDRRELAFAPRKGQLDADITIPRAHYYRSSGVDYDVRLVHWSNYKTMQSQYRFETEKLHRMRKNMDKSWRYQLLYGKKLRLCVLRLGDIGAFAWRVRRKLKIIAQGWHSPSVGGTE